MSDRQKKREHIRAARNWLGQAEHSLARDREAQGDLKLLLARAELARAESGSPWGRLSAGAVKGVAFLAALALAIGGWQVLGPGFGPLQQDMVSRHMETPLAGAAIHQAETQPEALPAPLAASTGTAEPGSPISAASPHMTYQPERHREERQEPAPREEEAGSGEETGQAAPMAAAPAVPPVPDAETQLLMQKAGEVLRR